MAFTIEYVFKMAVRGLANVKKISKVTKDVSRGMKTAGQSVDTFGGKINRLGQRLSRLKRDQLAYNRAQAQMGVGGRRGRRGGLSRTDLVAGAGGGLMARGMIGELFSFSDIMNTIDSNLGTDADRAMRPLIEKAVMSAAMSSKFTSVEVGGIALELARMGRTSQQIIDQLSTVTNFATATGGNAGEAADVLTNLAKITGKTLTETADLFTATFTSSPQTFHDIAEGLKYSTLLLKKYNITLEEMMASSQILAEQKVKGAMTGTATARMLNAILKPSGPVNKALAKIGIDRDDFLNDEGKLKGGMTQFFKVFEDAEQSMRDKGIKDAGKRMVKAMTLMFKERGSLAFAPLYENYKEWKKRLEDLQPHNVFDRTSKAALERMKGVAGAIFVIKSAWSALIQDIGTSGLNDDIVKIKDVLKSGLDWFSNRTDFTKNLTGRAILLGSAFAMMVIPLAIVAASLRAIGAFALVGKFALWAVGVGAFAARINTVRRAVFALGLGLKTVARLFRGAFILSAIVQILMNLGKIKAFFSSLSGDIGNAMSGVSDIITGAFTLDLDKITSGYEKAVQAAQNAIQRIMTSGLSAIGQTIGVDLSGRKITDVNDPDLAGYLKLHPEIEKRMKNKQSVGVSVPSILPKPVVPFPIRNPMRPVTFGGSATPQGAASGMAQSQANRVMVESQIRNDIHVTTDVNVNDATVYIKDRGGLAGHAPLGTSASRGTNMSTSTATTTAVPAGAQ